ncbi:hypothetical protein AGLY_005070 [Aphis glycines]|uniref:Uncharacterized protein n=1 Tax=Aphis glycines TaxID=307491 RepID=A0A6G0TVP5_APHGL|nr:hypothetical protein AGLY_005070 [Aphis glycines]
MVLSCLVASSFTNSDEHGCLPVSTEWITSFWMRSRNSRVIRSCQRLVSMRLGTSSQDRSRHQVRFRRLLGSPGIALVDISEIRGLRWLWNLACVHNILLSGYKMSCYINFYSAENYMTRVALYILSRARNDRKDDGQTSTTEMRCPTFFIYILIGMKDEMIEIRELSTGLRQRLC